MVILLVIFGGTSIEFWIEATPIYIPTSSVQGVPLFHILTNIVISYRFDDSHSNRSETMPHCGFDSHYPDN